MMYLFKQKEYQIFLYNSYLFNYTDETKDITYDTEELHVDCTNKLLQEEGKINTFTNIQTCSDSLISDIMESTIQHYNTDTSNDNDNDDNDNKYYWEHDNSTNKSNVDQAQNDRN